MLGIDPAGPIIVQPYAKGWQLFYRRMNEDNSCPLEEKECHGFEANELCLDGGGAFQGRGLLRHGGEVQAKRGSFGHEGYLAGDEMMEHSLEDGGRGRVLWEAGGLV